MVHEAFSNNCKDANSCYTWLSFPQLRFSVSPSKLEQNISAPALFQATQHVLPGSQCWLSGLNEANKGAQPSLHLLLSLVWIDTPDAFSDGPNPSIIMKFVNYSRRLYIFMVRVRDLNDSKAHRNLFGINFNLSSSKGEGEQESSTSIFPQRRRS